ncbi:MAG: helix-turn-helix domain-containing protein [Candidatus Doudnabacteria bacterium]|nr:helix-turn-helix domain-containing protein [Candidatus Doudnabacteria bacterium]
MSEESRELLSLKEAAAISPYGAGYLNLLARKGKIKATKIGRDWLITKSDLFEYIKKQHQESTTREQHLAHYLQAIK